ncbi:MAG: hypothetical protein MJK07_23230 [Flavobacteriales bacterium]|nr:hypothetical protein [Flavobacteriales bacterium]
MKERLFTILFLTLIISFNVEGQIDSLNGSWKVVSQNTSTEELVLKRSKKLKPHSKSTGIILSSDSTSFRFLFLPSCGVGTKKKTKGIRGTWKRVADNIIEIRSVNPYQNNTIIEKFRILSPNPRKNQLLRIHYEVIEAKES